MRSILAAAALVAVLSAADAIDVADSVAPGSPLVGALDVMAARGGLLHLLGLDHTRLSFYNNGIERRLTDVHGHVIEPVLA